MTDRSNEVTVLKEGRGTHRIRFTDCQGEAAR
jgi:hypothetical protein